MHVGDELLGGQIVTTAPPLLVVAMALPQAPAARPKRPNDDITSPRSQHLTPMRRANAGAGIRVIAAEECVSSGVSVDAGRRVLNDPAGLVG